MSAPAPPITTAPPVGVADIALRAGVAPSRVKAVLGRDAARYGATKVRGCGPTVPGSRQSKARRLAAAHTRWQVPAAAADRLVADLVATKGPAHRR